MLALGVQVLGAVDVSDLLAFSLLALIFVPLIYAAIRDFLENWDVVLAMVVWIVLAAAVVYGIYLLFEHDVLKW